MPWVQDANGVWSKYADTPQAAETERARINAALAAGKSIGGASPEFGQSLAALALIPVGTHAVSMAILGALGARTAAGAAVGTAGGVVAARGGGAALGAGLGLTAAGIIPLATTGLKVGAGIYGLDWLQKNWWIPALFIGGFIALKYLDKKR